MDATTCLLVSGLADDHPAVRVALTAAAKLVMGPFAVVIDPVVPPAEGFELLVAVPEPVTPADLERLGDALAAELHRREVMHAELTLELLPEAGT